uniref:Uncharacterized protein n=1 Tax=Cannabis sativa TaxID=3483 RepID=A0A803P9G4_CANSA
MTENHTASITNLESENAQIIEQMWVDHKAEVEQMKADHKAEVPRIEKVAKESIFGISYLCWCQKREMDFSFMGDLLGDFEEHCRKAQAAVNTTEVTTAAEGGENGEEATSGHDPES